MNMSSIQNSKKKLNENLEELFAVLVSNGVDVSNFDCESAKKDFEGIKEREAKQKREWYYAHRDLIREFFRTPAGKAQKREWDKKYYELHREEILQKRREKRKQDKLKKLSV